MDLQKPVYIAKWQQMITIVNQNSALLQPNRKKVLKKMYLLRLISMNILVCFIQFSGLNLSTFSAALPLWFATGTACAYFFLRGYTILPGMWLGNFFAYYLANAGLLLAAYSASLLCLQALLLYSFNSRYLKPTLLFYEFKIFLIFILYTAVLTALISVSLVYLSYPSMPGLKLDKLELGLQWWLANFNAIIIFSSAFICWDAYFSDSYLLKKASSISYGLFLLFAMTSVLMCCSSSLLFIKLEFILSLLLMIIIAYLYALPGAMGAIFLSGILLSFGVWFQAPIEQVPLFTVQLFLAFHAILGLGVSTRPNNCVQRLKLLRKSLRSAVGS